MQHQNAHRTSLLWRKSAGLRIRRALMPDTLLAASAPEAGIALVAAITTDLVAEIRDRHDLWPTATAAVGRLTTGAALFGASLKGNERISLQIAGEGSARNARGRCVAVGRRAPSGARGYARNARVDLPIDARGKFDVAGAIGVGLAAGNALERRSGSRTSASCRCDRARSPKTSPSISRSRSRFPASSRSACWRTRAASSPPAGFSRERCREPTNVRSRELERRARVAMPPVTQLDRARRRCGGVAARARGRLEAALAARDGRALRLPLQSREGRSGAAWGSAPTSCLRLTRERDRNRSDLRIL